MGFLFGSSSNAAKTPKATGIQIQTSSYGMAIPIVYGRTRIPGNLIGYYDFTAEKKEQGGKGGVVGGGGKGAETYEYSATLLFALCQGPIDGILKIWDNEKTWDLSKYSAETKLGSYSQAAFSHLTSDHSDEALNYRGVAMVLLPNFNMGMSASIPNLNYEVAGIRRNIEGQEDSDPADVIEDYLTNGYHGADFPADVIGDLSTYSDYCRAAGLLVSPVFSEQTEAAQALNDLVQWTNAEIVWNGGAFTIVPYGDEALTGNGVTYTPPASPSYALTADDLILMDGEPRVRVSRTRPADAVNSVSGEYRRRSRKYNLEEVSAKLEANIQQYGLREESAQQLHFFCVGTVARLALQLYLQRAQKLNTYEFYLSWKYALLDPMDVISLTDSLYGLDEKWLRIVSIEEDEDGRLKITAEDYESGSGHSVSYPVAESDGYDSDTHGDADPGDVNTPIIFEPSYRLTDSRQIWIAASGSDSDWAGCEVWASTTADGDYTLAGTIGKKPAMGVLSADLPVGTGDPDVGGTLSVDLSMSAGTLSSVTSDDADHHASLCLVGDELLSYTTATLTTANHYDLTRLVRAGYGTTRAAHLTGDRFVRLDERVFKTDYDPRLSGRTVYFKFLSFNSQYLIGRGTRQGLEDVDPYSYTISGITTPQALSAGSGVALVDDPITGTTVVSRDQDSIQYHGIEANGALSISGSVVTMASGNNAYWFQGSRYTTANAITCDLNSDTVKDTDSGSKLQTNKMYYCYFKDATGTLYWSTNVWSLKTKVSVCSVYWNGSAGALCKETHNHTRDLDWHINAHLTIGARYYSGLDLVKPTTTYDSSLELVEGVIYDEDLSTTITNALSKISRIWYLTGGVYTWVDSSLPYAGSSGDPKYANGTTLVSVADSKFVNMWAYASPDVDRPVYIVPDTAEYNTVALARAVTPPVLAGMGLTPELKLIYRFIYRGDGEFQESTDYRVASSLPSGFISSTSASAVSFVPHGTIASANVQAAIEELTTEKAPMHLYGTTDPPDPTGLIEGTIYLKYTA